jgi:hypothetical protein
MKTFSVTEQKLEEIDFRGVEGLMQRGSALTTLGLYGLCPRVTISGPAVSPG